MTRISSLFEALDGNNQFAPLHEQTEKKTSVFDVLNKDTDEADLNEAAKLLPKNAVRKFWLVSLDLIKDGGNKSIRVHAEAPSEKEAARFVEDNFFTLAPHAVAVHGVEATHKSFRVTNLKLIGTLDITEITSYSQKEVKEINPTVASLAASEQSKLNKDRRTNLTGSLDIVVLNNLSSEPGMTAIEVISLVSLPRYIDKGWEVFGKNTLRQPLFHNTDVTYDY